MLHAFEPFTISPVLKVKLDKSSSQPTTPSLPTIMILKVFDRRFARDLRAWHNAAELTQEFEDQFRSFVASGAANKTLDEWEAERSIAEELDKDHPPLEMEAFLMALLSSYHDNEIKIYNRLAALQGISIPFFYGQVKFVPDEIHPNTFDISMLGILLEYIEGETLSSLPASIMSNDICSACVDVVNACGDAGVLNKDVSLENFIVPLVSLGVETRPARPRLVVMIDFAQCRLRHEDEDDKQWKAAKWEVDEEGAVGYPLKKRFGCDYRPSRRYMVVEPDD